MSSTLPDTATDETSLEEPVYSVPQFLLGVGRRIVFFLMLYLLSFGPFFQNWYNAFWLDRDKEYFIERFYGPLIVLCQQSELFRRWLEWYVMLWN